MAATLFGSGDSPVTPRFEAVPPTFVKKISLDASVTVSPIISQPSRPRGSINKEAEDTRVNRTLFVGNIPASCSKKHIKQLLKGYGSVESIRLRSVKVIPGDVPASFAKRRHKHLIEGSTFNAYVVFSSNLEAESCLSLDGTTLQGRHLKVDMVGKRDTKKYDHHKSIFIGNLSFSADEEKLRAAFSICGDINSVRIVRDSRSGVGKGFGYVTFMESMGVMFALQQNKKIKLDGRTLRVSKSKDMQMDKQAKFSGITYSSYKLGGNPLPSKRVVGKKRPDGTKNRHFRA